eukprot:TRINITY_DN7464_c0_g1_i1.p1 TRINITY_DN7464_c0_g1~~TRINITY_DN7464_c0_g1_i1.p1  ORF type:complete len:203 (+),score=43.69 TRINITY_DN7464_c0_g1_i1:253-861(+)
MSSARLVVIGEGSCGKSALSIRYVQGMFIERYEPTIEDSYMKQIEVDDTHMVVEILDTAGSDLFTAMRDLYMKNGDGFALVYDVTQPMTFTALRSVYDQMLRVKDLSPDDPNPPPVLIVGNKIDLTNERKVVARDGEMLAKEWKNAGFMETSAKEDINVEAMFTELLKLVLKRRASTRPPTNRERSNSMSSYFKRHVYCGVL